MRFSIFIFFFSFCFAIAVCAQSNSAETQSTLQSMEGGGMFRSFDKRAKETKGSLKIFEEYLPGGITMNSGQEFEFNRMNYDGYYDAIVVIRKKEEQVVTTMMVKSFYIVDVTDTLYFDRLLRNDNRMGYYQRLSDGKNVKLYKKLFTTFQQATYTGAYSLGSSQAELTPSFTYYTQESTMRPREFKGKKELFELFPDEKHKLQEYLKEKKTDFKKDADVIALINYLDSIKMPSVGTPGK
jgi:hypothetical protein